jgi:hypothetical protein
VQFWPWEHRVLCRGGFQSYTVLTGEEHQSDRCKASSGKLSDSIVGWFTCSLGSSGADGTLVWLSLLKFWCGFLQL